MRKEFKETLIIAFIEMLVFFIIITILIKSNVIKTVEKQNNKDEQIKQLEQSLAEQLQEKNVYMKMLERKDK